MSGDWGKLGTVSQVFSVRKSALEPNPNDALIILSEGLNWARENFKTLCSKPVLA